MDANGQQMKAVFTVIERPNGKSFWIRVGVGFVNRDGSITLKLDALPVNGTLQVREWEAREEGRGAGGEEPPRGRPRRDEHPGGPGVSPARRNHDLSGGLA